MVEGGGGWWRWWVEGGGGGGCGGAAAQPARLPPFPSPVVANQAPGFAGAEELRAREALQPDTFGPSAPLGRAQCSTEEYVDHWVPLAAAAVSSLKRAGTAFGAMTGRGEADCRGRGLCLNGRIRIYRFSDSGFGFHCSVV